MKPNQILLATLAAYAALASTVTFAAVTPEEAAKLKTTLTPMGAERAANKDGTIPAWDGGYTKVAPNWKPGDPRPDPFPGDKPRLTIDAKNVDQHADKLSEVTKAMLKKIPGWRIDVYPTQRTAAAPQWVYDNTFKNATRAKTTKEGYGLEGAYGGVPFPIPKDGYEVVQNHRLAWYGAPAEEGEFRTWLMSGAGNLSMTTRARLVQVRPYYDKNGSLEKFDGMYQKSRLDTLEPASKAGEKVLAHDHFDTDKRSVWQYLVGQRRVRKAPSVSYDTPDFVSSGTALWDESFGLLAPVDRHEFKLVGKQELYVPYNNNRALASKINDLVKPGFLNPDLVRWELHRVWVVEATLVQGKRHVVPKRRYYFDEDTWQVLLSDGWDASGQIWRGFYALTSVQPDVPLVNSSTQGWGVINLQTGAYILTGAPNETKLHVRGITPPSPNFFSPDELANDGAR